MICSICFLFQSTLPLRGATVKPLALPQSPKDFNPRSPYGERLFAGISRAAFYKFQSTLPLRGATSRPPKPGMSAGYFNPRSPYGERQPGKPGALCQDHFNPRSPYGERRGENDDLIMFLSFQSTLPLRGATLERPDGFTGQDISIHAPLTGSDRPGHKHRRSHPHFNPRSPYGERRKERWWLPCITYFNPRSPYGERLSQLTSLIQSGNISIHAPLTGSDCRCHIAPTGPSDFNPRSPYGERRNRKAKRV